MAGMVVLGLVQPLAELMIVPLGRTPSSSAGRGELELPLLEVMGLSGG